jgi:MFS transporter, ACS family, allantoate permease
LNIPGGVVGAVTVLGVGWLSDKWNDRSLVMLIYILPTIVAAALMVGLDPNGHPMNRKALEGMDEDEKSL